MARIVEQAAASGPDGIISTIADFDVLSGPLSDAVDRGLGTAAKGELNAEQLQDMMAGGAEMAELRASLGGTV